MLAFVLLAFAADPIQLAPADLAWAPGPATLPAGARVVVLEGDPKGTGLFTMRVELPAKAALPTHTHAGDERVTVLSGAVRVAVEGLPAREIGAGGYYVTPAGRKHDISTASGAVLQMTGMGPWTLELVK